MTEELVPGIKRVPVPWGVKGQGWIFPVYTPFSSTPIKVPEGSYSEFEAGTSFDLSERFHGGVGLVMAVRYLEGPGLTKSVSVLSLPAGPYDELLWIPGLFSKVDKPEEYFLTTTRIYVSTDASVANGRKEWGVPKHRANFSFTPLAPNSSKIHLTVSHPTEPTPQPFFSAMLSDSNFTPFAIPVSTSWLSWPISRYFLDGYTATLIQPPLPSSVNEPEKARLSLKETNQTVEVFVGSDGKTLAFTPTSIGWSKLSYLEAKAPEGGNDEDWTSFGDGKGFPKFQVAKEGILGGKGVRLTSFDMHIPGGVVVGTDYSSNASPKSKRSKSILRRFFSSAPRPQPSSSPLDVPPLDLFSQIMALNARHGDPSIQAYSVKTRPVEKKSKTPKRVKAVPDTPPPPYDAYDAIMRLNARHGHPSAHFVR
ncbi:uncharacterized protein JCM6883_001084 [Sporobolomyces salmoneus]|uniref:uncharacterized protein n=1 Tax=Sporobolomyces salmoneus TaxID=183962 RepID=UPI00316DA446